MSYPGNSTKLGPPIEIQRDYSRHPIPGQLALWLTSDPAGDRAPIIRWDPLGRAARRTATHSDK